MFTLQRPSLTEAKTKLQFRVNMIVSATPKVIPNITACGNTGVTNSIQIPGKGIGRRSCERQPQPRSTRSTSRRPAHAKQVWRGKRRRGLVRADAELSHEKLLERNRCGNSHA
jgi:hypothetical protein